MFLCEVDAFRKTEPRSKIRDTAKFFCHDMDKKAADPMGLAAFLDRARYHCAGARVLFLIRFMIICAACARVICP